MSPAPVTDSEDQLTAIGVSLKNPAAETWVPNALNLVQAVLCPLLSSASDVFQVRKPLLVGSLAIAVVGAAIAPGSQTIYRLIAAQVLIGVGFTSVALGYSIPSEVLPRRWRPSKHLNPVVVLAGVTDLLSQWGKRSSIWRRP